MKLIGLLLRASRAGVVLSILFGLLAGASFTGLISLINRVVSGQAGASPPVIAAFISVGVFALVMRIASQMLANRLHYGVIFDLRMQLCRQLLATPLRRLEESGAHRLMAVLTDDVISVSTGLVTLPNIIINLAIVAGCLVFLGWLSWGLLLCMLAFMAVGIATYRQPTMWAVAIMGRARQLQDALFKHFRGLTEGMKELKLHLQRRESFLREELERTASELRALQIRGNDIFAISASWGVFLFFIFIGVLLFVIPRFIEVERTMLVGYTLVVLYLQQPLQYLTDCMPFLGRGTIALRKIEELGVALERQSSEEQEDASEAEGEPPSFSRMELIGVTHSYLREQENSRFTLGPIHLFLERGEIVFLVGGNGSGKTTLAKLIAGLYVPESGEIHVDGVPVTGKRLGGYRRHFSAVFSDFYLFERLLGLPPDNVARQAQGYLEKLQLSHKVRLEGNSLSTTNLSQGQRKRLALLTAYLEDRPIYIFDEWAADQDPSFKEVFYRGLLPELKRRGKTVVVISHDDRYFPVADRILRLESGSLLPPQQGALVREAVP